MSMNSSSDILGHMGQQEKMVVSEGEKGKVYHVESISLEEQIQRRLEMLAMTQGARLEILNKKRGSAIILKVRGTRFAIGRQIADGIAIGE